MKRYSILFAISFFLATSAHATTFNLYGVSTPVTGYVDFNYNPTKGVVEIDLSNTSLIDSVLTSFAFNAPADGSITGIDKLQSDGVDNWGFFFELSDTGVNPDLGINTPGKFGLFDLGAGTGKNFNGGFPNEGIVDGTSAYFELWLKGPGLATLTTDSFLSLLSEGGSGSDPQYFIARYQGLPGDKSDVAIPRPPVPEPSTFVLLGMGIAGLAFLSRKKKNA